jgi:hypothetical protein
MPPSYETDIDDGRVYADEKTKHAPVSTKCALI